MIFTKKYLDLFAFGFGRTFLCSEPLFVMPWALRGISAGAIMSTEIVNDEEDETRSVSRTSSIMLIGRMYFILHIVS